VKNTLGAICGVALLASILIANYVTTRYGFIPVGFGVTATAGTFAAGFALAFRDGVQDAFGRLATVGLIAIGAVLSFLVASPAIAIASAVAFLVSELADLTVYTPLRNRGEFGGKWWAIAVLISGLVGAILDSILFLGIAFGFAAVGGALLGQLIGKTWASLGYLAVGKAVSTWRS
jgi:uncharacterized PurR-regulated membrane protein YhhQ (DUF165 family)